MVEIRYEGVSKVFDTPSGQEVAVDNIDLTIEDTEFFSLVGPSGCGKTTTLRMLAGLETPTSGEIYFDDEPVTSLPPQDRDIAMVFQNVTLYPHMTNYDNIGYGLKVRGETENMDEKIHDVAKVLEIDELLDKQPGQLSGGQQQRVALGRALIRDPNAVLLDEPLSDLDAKLKSELRVVIERIHDEFQTTMVYVTHDQQEAMTMSDRIGTMNDGKIAQTGSPRQIFDQPVNEFVATFIGQPSMNIVDATLRDNLQLEVEGSEAVLDLSAASDALGGKTGDVRLGFRPSAVTLGAGTDGILPATVDVWENIGTEYIVHLRRDDGAEMTAMADTIPWEESGETVSIEGLNRLYIFDADTTETICQVDTVSVLQPATR